MSGSGKRVFGAIECRAIILNNRSKFVILSHQDSFKQGVWRGYICEKVKCASHSGLIIFTLTLLQ